MRFCFLLCFLTICHFTATTQEWTLERVPVYRSFDEFEPLLENTSDTTYLVNFWATWCAPCVRELPYFEEIQALSENKKLKVILVSLDFEKHLESRFIPFLNKQAIQSDVVLLLDSRESEWIDRVDTQWSGALPVTIVYRKDRREVYEKSFHSTDELKKILKPYLNI